MLITGAYTWSTASCKEVNTSPELHENDGRISRHRARPLQVQVGLRQIALADAGVGLTRHQNLLQMDRRQIELAAEGVNIGNIDVGLSHDHQLLPGAIDTGGVERRDIVDGGEIVRSHLMMPRRRWYPLDQAAASLCCAA